MSETKNVFPGAHKVLFKAKGKKESSATTRKVADALADIEQKNEAKELAAALKPLKIVSAEEVTVDGNSAIVIFVPYVVHQRFRQIQPRLARALEKKFSVNAVLIVAQRKILRAPKRNNRKAQQKRPRSRTLTAVHDSILEDIVFPHDIVGRRTRFKLDGNKQEKVYLDKNDQLQLENKTGVYAAVYKKLTGKDASFLFPAY